MSGDLAQCCYHYRMWSTLRPRMLLAYQVKLKRPYCYDLLSNFLHPRISTYNKLKLQDPLMTDNPTFSRNAVLWSVKISSV